jgi:DNA ligase 1
MRRFARLYDALDSTTSTNAKVAAMREYFATAPPEDAAWAVFFLTGARLKRVVGPAKLAAWCMEWLRVPAWLFEESMGVAGDLPETIALLVDTARGGTPPQPEERPLSRWIEERMLPLRGAEEGAQKAAVIAAWEHLPRLECFLFTKLLTGELRVGVSATLAMRAVAAHAGVDAQVVAHRLMGGWQPSAAAYAQLVSKEHADADVSRPYPFALASPLDAPVETLGPRADWLAEWKWDGIRAQLIRRAGRTFLWSRGEELITDRYPELASLAEALPDGTVLDGEVLGFHGDRPLSFGALQTRIGRHEPGAEVLAGSPTALVAYDLLEEQGVDLRALPLRERRARLVALCQGRHSSLRLSEEVPGDTWEALAAQRAQSRERGVEGLMLKRWSSPYVGGRRRGDLWKWKIDPWSIDAVLIYAQPGQGRRASLFTDLTFGVWQGRELLPIAKAYSGLSDEELARLDKWIRQHTIERHGPVRAVEPVHVFELHFEGIQESARHKSGIAVRFPRIARWRTDKRPEDADTLERVRALLVAQP